MCLVVLTSGQDEALLSQCAYIMAGWSTSPEFVGVMGRKAEVDRSIAVLMQSVATATRVRITSEACIRGPLKRTARDGQ